MYLKRQKAPKNWPIKKKGTAYVVRPKSNLNNGLPILIALRDILKLAQNRKEVKKAIHLKNILINGKYPKNEKNSLLLFDTLTIVPSKENYRLSLSDKGKFMLEKIKEGEELRKIAKIINRKTLKRKKVQLNLSDGRNFLSDIKCDVDDSVTINLKDKKIEKCLPLKENEEVLVFAGKHAGTRGKVERIDKEKKIAGLEVQKKKINVLIKQLMVIK